MVVKLKNQQGSVLVFSLIVMAMLFAAALSLAFLLLMQIKKGQNQDQALAAYYAAETGLEQSLDYFFTQRVDKSSNLEDTLDYIRGFYDALDTGSTYALDSIGTSGSADNVNFKLEKFGTKQLDLINPEATFASLDIDKFVLNWNDTCDAGVPSRIELSWVQWPETGWLDESGYGEAVIKNIFTCGSLTPETGWQCKLEDVTPSPGYNYRVRIKSLDCDLPYLSAELEDALGNAVNFPGWVTLKARGSSQQGKTLQALEAQLPWRLPLSGLGDYVLFSAGDIIK